MKVESYIEKMKKENPAEFSKLMKGFNNEKEVIQEVQKQSQKAIKYIEIYQN